MEHTKSPVVQADEYYPFGLTFNSYRRENGIFNRIKFQGQEHIDDLSLEWDSFKWRNHQPDIGRFFNVDPLAEKYYYNSPYAFSENKVTSYVELEGLEAVETEDKRPKEQPQENQPGAIEQGLMTLISYFTDLGSTYNTMLGNEDASDDENLMTGFTVVAQLATAPMEAEQMVMEGASGSPANKADDALSQVDEGVNLVIKGKSTWNSSQNQQAFAKAAALTDDPTTVVTKNPVARDSNLRSKFIKAGGTLAPRQQVDHIKDLQLGGTNAISNTQALDGSVNASFGKQIQLQIQHLPDATRVNKVIYLPYKKR
ncbi:RHS repeat domain-containing protein [Ohtaekwangia kribbensis]|uniref:RHS repeat domain-containing protein n=1 Tax=Ohtaekwangia kribbensis TaxID=688913 RepID=A0ABW3K5F1_9BACT